LYTEDGLYRAAVPSGASTGVYEALELRDADKDRLLGKGCLKAVSNINTLIAPKLVGLDVTKQTEIDKLMVETLDGSKNQWGWSKSKLGANAILAVSMAVCRAGAQAYDLELYEYIAQISDRPRSKFVMPVPSFNVINGGSHAGNRLACQEFMILPVGASSFREAMNIGAEVYHTLKSVIKKKYGQDACNVGDEGGFAPSVQDNNEALDVLMQAIEISGHKDKVKIGTDVAASEFYDADSKTYDFDFKNPRGSAPEMKRSGAQMISLYKNWIEKYPLISIEDPFDQDDWETYSQFMAEVGVDTQIVGDDLLVTNPTRVQKGMDVKACNALLLKVNQIGSITEAIEAACMSQAAGWGVMVSHRSGETEDSFIADLAVGLCAGQIKTGAPCRSERLAKYNQLLRIEETLGDDAVFAGTSFRQPYRLLGLSSLSGPVTRKNVVVIGYGPTGNAFIKELLNKGGSQYKITVLCDEPYAAYNRVKLTSYFTHRDVNQIALSSEEWCNNNSVELVFGRAAKIDRAGKRVEYTMNKTGDSRSIAYHELVLATGSKPFVPPAPPGLSPDTKGILLYRTIDDCVAIVERAKKNTKVACVIGGGLLGLEAAKAVYDLNIEVHVIEFAPWCLGVQIDPEAGALVKKKVEALGVFVHTATKTLEVLSGADGVTALKISEDGTEKTIMCEMVIISAGVRPRQELAEGCGLELGSRGGVKVDYRMRSSTDANVHAIGEIAALNGGMCYGMSAPGYAQAAVLAEHLTNSEAKVKYQGSDLSTKLKLMGVDVGSFGASDSFWFGREYNCTDETKVKNLIKRDEAKGMYKKLVFTPDGKKMLGGVLVGDVADFAKLSAICMRPDIGELTPEDILNGKSPKVDDGGDGTNLGEQDLVCNCHCVPKATIIKAIEGGAVSFGGISAATKAGTGCGTCVSTGPMPRLLAHHLKKLAKPQGICSELPFSAAELETLAKTRGLKTLEELVGQLSFPGATVSDQVKKLAQPILDKVFNGRKKGEGLDLPAQLKALRKDLWEFVDQMNCNPILVRLAWHDSGTYHKDISTFPECGGANGSIRFGPEIQRGANNGLDKALKFLAPFKDEFPGVSWADIMQMASAVSIEHAGGPKIPMKYGRVDVTRPEDCPGDTTRGTGANAGLPDAEAPFGCGAPDPAQHLRNIFYRMGFNDQEIVAISGAHTLGRAFKERSGLVAEGYGESNACPFTKAVGLNPIRKDGKAGVGMPGGKSWTKKWLKFDNSYYADYKEKDPNLAWFSTDRCLHEDQAFTPTFRKYAADQNVFFADYALAHAKLSELGSKFEPAGGIIID
jgi:enolase